MISPWDSPSIWYNLPSLNSSRKQTPIGSGRQNNCSQKTSTTKFPKAINVFVITHVKRDFADVIKVKNFEMWWLSCITPMGGSSLITPVLKNGKEWKTGGSEKCKLERLDVWLWRWRKGTRNIAAFSSNWWLLVYSQLKKWGLWWLILCVSLTRLRGAQITGKTFFLGVSMRLFLKDINIWHVVWVKKKMGLTNIGRNQLIPWDPKQKKLKKGRICFLCFS